MLPKFKYDRGRKTTHNVKSSILGFLKEMVKSLSPCLERPHMADTSDAKPAITADVPIPPQWPQGNPRVFSDGVSLGLILMTVS